MINIFDVACAHAVDSRFSRPRRRESVSKYAACNLIESFTERELYDNRSPEAASNIDRQNGYILYITPFDAYSPSRNDQIIFIRPIYILPSVLLQSLRRKILERLQHVCIFVSSLKSGSHAINKRRELVATAACSS